MTTRPPLRTHREAALEAVKDNGIHGITSKELGDLPGFYYGPASGTLSILHRDGVLDRLAQKRQGFSVYTTKNNTRGRKVRQPRQSAATALKAEIERLEEENARLRGYLKAERMKRLKVERRTRQ